MTDYLETLPEMDKLLIENDIDWYGNAYIAIEKDHNGYVSARRLCPSFMELMK